MVFTEAVELRENLRKSLVINTSEACLFLRNPDGYGQVLNQMSENSEQITSMAVRRFLAACRLQAGEEGRESLGAIGKLWKRFPKILAEGDENLHFFKQDRRLAYLMAEAGTVACVPASALEFFLEKNEKYGRRVTPFKYKIGLESGSGKFKEITYFDWIDSVDRKKRVAVATVIDARNVRKRRDLDASSALKLFMAEQAFGQSETIGGLPFCFRVWDIISGNCFQLDIYDKKMASEIARRTAWAMQLGIERNRLHDQAIRFDLTCRWSRVT
jgi:hypothetical protein